MRAGQQPSKFAKRARAARNGLVLALLIGLLFGFTKAGEPLEQGLQIARNKLRSHPASGQVVLVAIDTRSVEELGAAPWAGDRLAALTTRIDASGARRIHVDADFGDVGDARQAAALEAALAGSRADLLLPARFSINPITGARTETRPPSRFARHASLVNTNVYVWWDGAVWRHPFGAAVGDGIVPSLGAVLGGLGQASEGLFALDYGIDIRSIPTVSASDVLSGRVPASQFARRDVVIARTDSGAEGHKAPGFAVVPSIMFQLVAAETIRAGRPVDLGWLLPLALALLMAAAILLSRRRMVAVAILVGAGAGAIAVPLLLEANQVHAEIVPALAAVVVAAIARLVASLRRSFQVRGTTNPVTGMPNLQALRLSEQRAGAVVVARIINYAQITATLPQVHEKELVEQIASRLEFGSAGASIFQTEEGVFVWTADGDQEDVMVQQIEGLQALFRSPIVVAGRPVDVMVTVGLDLDASRPVPQRVASGLVAADEAMRTGRRWARFNPASAEDADWKISLLTRLDHAIDHHELWVAYQPKVDCQSGAILGAEALVRWSHPEKGAIYPDQFVGPAEQGGRIDRLTYFVLDDALAAAAQINRGGTEFHVAVNLSALLLYNEDLVAKVNALLREHGVRPELLTLEVTETSTLASEGGQISNLRALADLGVRLSIDDYGTGFSTLEYLRSVPASEIKIDRSFISLLCSSQSDRIMVNSTIQLAHSLKRKVVAEGVENEEILQELRKMHCDVAQGYHLGRPMPLSELLERLAAKREKAA